MTFSAIDVFRSGWAFVVCVALCICGCGEHRLFPTGEQDDVAQRAFRVGSESPNFFLFSNDRGRVTHIGYDRTGDGLMDEKIYVDGIDPRQAPHFVFILDGYGFECVSEYYKQGGLRLFHPPSLVISPYPAMTDLAMTDLLGSAPCEGFEARYFNRRQNRVVGGSWAYMRGGNQLYNEYLDYRAPMLWDALGYVWPVHFFKRELERALESIHESSGTQHISYFVTSAGISTQKGLEGQRESLAWLEQLIHRLVWESRGMVKITILADHGHGYVACRRIGLEDFLKQKGWRETNKLEGPRDVVYIRFGLETYVALSTHSPGDLSDDLMELEGVDLASYVQGSEVVVLSSPRDGAGVGRARIQRRDTRYAYRMDEGDPLALAGILATLQVDEDGFYDADDLLAATARHIYPAPLQRVWRAHFALAKNVPDVIVSLHDEWYSGSDSFGSTVSMASTHGSLNYSNSATFIMSTIGPLPEVMLSKQVPVYLEELTGRRFPMKR